MKILSIINKTFLFELLLLVENITLSGTVIHKLFCCVLNEEKNKIYNFRCILYLPTLVELTTSSALLSLWLEKPLKVVRWLLPTLVRVELRLGGGMFIHVYTYL